MKYDYTACIQGMYIIILIMLDTCPDGSEPVNCFADPCQDATCASFPEATCQSDFCGGCNARFFVRRREVTDLCGRLLIHSAPVA